MNKCCYSDPVMEAAYPETYLGCEEEGTHCAGCACSMVCIHMANLVCATHHDWLEGYTTAAYQIRELQLGEDFEPEDLELMYEILQRYARLWYVLGSPDPTQHPTRNWIDGNLFIVPDPTNPRPRPLARTKEYAYGYGAGHHPGTYFV